MDFNPNARRSQEDMRAWAQKQFKTEGTVTGPQTKEDQLATESTGFRTILSKDKRQQVKAVYERNQQIQQELLPLLEAQRLKRVLNEYGADYFKAKDLSENIQKLQSQLNNTNWNDPSHPEFYQIGSPTKKKLEDELAQEVEKFNNISYAKKIKERKENLKKDYGIDYDNLTKEELFRYNLGYNRNKLTDKWEFSPTLVKHAKELGTNPREVMEISRDIAEINAYQNALGASNDYLDDGWGEQFIDGLKKGLFGDIVGKKEKSKDWNDYLKGELAVLDKTWKAGKFTGRDRLGEGDFEQFKKHIELASQNAFTRGGDMNMFAQGLGYSIGALPMFIMGLGTKMFDVSKLGAEWFKMLATSPLKTGGPRFAGDLMQAVKDDKINTPEELFKFVGKSYWENLTENIGELSTPLLARALPKISTAYSSFLNRLGGKLGRFTDYALVGTATEMLEEEISSTLMGEDSIFTGNFNPKRLAMLAATTGVMGMGFSSFNLLHKKAYINGLDAMLDQDPKLKYDILNKANKESLWDFSDEQLDNISKQAGVIISLKDSWEQVKDSVVKLQTDLADETNPLLNRTGQSLQQLQSNLTTVLNQETERFAEDVLYTFDGEALQKDVKEDLDIINKDLDVYNMHMDETHLKNIEEFNKSKTADMDQINSARGRVNASAGSEVLKIVQESDYSGMSPMEYQDFRNNLIDETYGASTRQSESIKFYSGSQEREYTPEKIDGPESLPENAVFVFGSNDEGIHKKGAALTASTKFGAVPGVSVGERGKSYAIVTKKDWRKEKSSTLPEIRAGIATFIRHAKKNPDKKYYVTKIGSSLAGYTVQEIGSLFKAIHTSGEDIPDNVVLPKEYDPRGTTPITTKSESSTPSENVTSAEGQTTQSKSLQTVQDQLIADLNVTPKNKTLLSELSGRDKNDTQVEKVESLDGNTGFQMAIRNILDEMFLKSAKQLRPLSYRSISDEEILKLRNIKVKHYTENDDPSDDFPFEPYYGWETESDLNYLEKWVVENLIAEPNSIITSYDDFIRERENYGRVRAQTEIPEEVGLKHFSHEDAIFFYVEQAIREMLPVIGKLQKNNEDALSNEIYNRIKLNPAFKLFNEEQLRDVSTIRVKRYTEEEIQEADKYGFDTGGYYFDVPAKTMSVNDIGILMVYDKTKMSFEEWASHNRLSENFPAEMDPRRLSGVSHEDIAHEVIDQVIDELPEYLYNIQEDIKNGIVPPEFEVKFNIQNSQAFYDLVEDKIKVLKDSWNKLSSNEKATVLNHETIHKYTVQGLIQPGEVGYNEKLYDAKFRGAIKALYDATKDSLPSYITAPTPVKGMSLETVQLAELISYGMTDKNTQEALAKIQYGPARKKNAWREFIKSIMDFIKGILPGLNPLKFSETALNNLIVEVTDYIDTYHPKMLPDTETEHADNQANANLDETSGNSSKDDFTANKAGLTSSKSTTESDRKYVDQTLTNFEVKSNVPTSKFLKEEFLDKDGNPIYGSTQQMLDDVARLRSENDNNDEAAYEVWKEKMLPLMVDQTDADNAQIMLNGLRNLEAVWLHLKGLTNHKVAYYDGSTLKIHSGTFPDYTFDKDGNILNEQSKSTVYRKQFYEYDVELINKKHNLNIEVVELNPGSKVTDATIPNLVKKGWIVAFNKGTVVLIKNSTMPNAIDGKDLQGMTPDQLLDYNSKSWIAYYRLLFGNDISQEALIKRIPFHSGNAPNTFVSDYVIGQLSNKQGIPWGPSAPISYDVESGAINVRTVQFEIGSDMEKHLKEILGEDYKPDLVGDGTIYSLPTIHDTYNMINGIDFTDWAISNKYKTFEIEEQLLKAADQTVPKDSPLAEWMKKYNIGKVIFSSARKVKGADIQDKGSITWEDILNDTSPNNVYSYDMRQDSFISSHGKVKQEIRGVSPSFFTVMLTSYMDLDTLKALTEHLNARFDSLYDKTLVNVNDVDFISKKLLKFIENNEDTFMSATHEFIRDNIKDNPNIGYILPVMDFFKQNVLQQELRDALSRQEESGIYPILMADAGDITNYKSVAEKWLKDHMNYDDKKVTELLNQAFDEKGFIKPGYVMIDRSNYETFEKHMTPGELPRLLLSGNPPASFADIRAVTVIGVISNRRFTMTRDSNNVNVIIDRNGMVVNIRDWQVISGKDFDIDKLGGIPIISGKPVEKVWDFLSKFDGSAKISRIRSKFKESYNSYEIGHPDVVEHEVNVAVMQKRIGLKVKGFDNALAHLIRLYGYNQTFQGLDITNGKQGTMIGTMMKSMLIGEVYNSRLFYSMVSEIGGEFDIKTKTGNFKIKIDPKKSDRNIGLLDALTNVTLDWSSDQKLLAFNYNNDRTTELLYDIYKLKGTKYERVFGNEAKVPMGTESVNAATYAYMTMVRPVRSLLKSNDLPDHKSLQNYAILMDMLKKGHKDLFTSGTNISKLQPNKDNPFWNTVLFHSTRHFYRRYLQSPIGTIGLTDAEWKQIMNTVSVKLKTTAEEEIMHNEDSIPHLMARFMNRLYNLNRRNIEFTDMSGGKGGAAQQDQENSLGAILEMSNIIYRLKSKGVSTELFEEGFVRAIKNIINTGLLRNSSFSKKLILQDGTSMNNNRWEIKVVDGKLTFKKVVVTNGREYMTQEFETFDEMFNDKTTNYSIEKAIVKMSVTKSDGGYTSSTAFQKMFKIRNNNSLSKPLASIVKDMYSGLIKGQGPIPGYVMTHMTELERGAFIKSGFGVFDTDADLSKGIRFVISYKQKSQSVTEDKVINQETGYSRAFNMTYSNPTSYTVFLDPYKDMNPQFKDIYDIFMDTFIDESYNVVEKRKGALSKGLLTPIRFYAHNPNVTMPEHNYADKKLNKYKADIAKLANDIFDTFGNLIKPHQIVDFWNMTHDSVDKINTDQIGDEHKIFFIKFLAESFFNFKISWEKTSKSKKEYNVMENVLKMFHAAQKDTDANKTIVTHTLGKFLPSQWYLKRMSRKNILMFPNESIPYIFNGTVYYISPFGLARSFHEEVRPDEPTLVSGAMIAQEIMRRLNQGFNDNIHTMENIGQSIIDSLYKENNYIEFTEKGDTPNENPVPYVLGKKFQATVYNIAESGLNKLIISPLDGSIIHNLKRYHIVEPPPSTSGSIKGGRTRIHKFEVPKWDQKVLTELATELAMKNYTPVPGSVEAENIRKSIMIRQYISALMQRYIYDYYTSALIDVQIQNLTDLSKHAGRMSPHIAYAVKSMIDGPGGSIERLESMKKQISAKAANLSMVGKKYMPRIFADESMYRRGLYEAEKAINDALPAGDPKKLTDEKLNAKVDSIMEAKDKQADRFGHPKELLNTNFFERERDDIGHHRKDVTVSGDYLAMLMLTFRHDFMSAYDFMYEEYTQHDSEQMQKEIRHQAAIVRTQNAYYVPTEFESLRKNKSVQFIYKGPSKPGFSNPYGTFISGEVMSIDIKNESFIVKLNRPLYDPSTKKSVENLILKKNDVSNLREIQPLTHARKLDYFIYQLTGSDVDLNEKSQVLGKWLVSGRNYSMLTMKVNYAPRNRYGSRLNRVAMFGNSKALKKDVKNIEAKYSNFVGLKSKSKDIPSNEFSDVDIATFNMLFEESTAVFGEVDELMGRFGADLKEMESLSAEQIALYNKLDMQWSQIKSELQPLYDQIVGTSEEIGQPDRWTDGKWEFLQKTFGAKGDAFMEFIFKGYHLYNPAAMVFNALGKDPQSDWLNASTVEKNNRIKTVMEAVAFYQSSFANARMTPREKKVFRGLMTDIAMALYKEAVISVDFGYQPALDLSHWDSTIWGRFWLQFSHYSNMQANIYFDKWLDLSKQFKQHGILELRKRKIGYTGRLRDLKTGEVYENEFTEVSALRQIFTMTWATAVVGGIRELTNAIGYIGMRTVLAGAIWDIASMAMNLVVADSMGVFPVTALLNIMAWGLQSLVYTGPDDDPVSAEDKERMNDDLKRIYFTVPFVDKDITQHHAKRMFAAIFGEDKEEYIAHEIWRLNEKADRDGWTKEERARITPEMIGATWELMQRQREKSSVPIVGVAMAQAYDYIMAISLGYMEALGHFEMMTSVASTQVPVFQVIMPLIQGMRPDIGFKKSQAKTLEYEIMKEYEIMERKEKAVQNQIDILAYNDNLIHKVVTPESFKTRQEKLEEKEAYLKRLQEGWRSPQYVTDSLTSRNYGFTFGNQLDSMNRGTLDIDNYKENFIDSMMAQTIYDSLLRAGTIDTLAKVYNDEAMNKDPLIGKEILEDFVPMAVPKIGINPSQRDETDIKQYIHADAERRKNKP